MWKWIGWFFPDKNGWLGQLMYVSGLSPFLSPPSFHCGHYNFQGQLKFSPTYRNRNRPYLSSPRQCLFSKHPDVDFNLENYLISNIRHKKRLVNIQNLQLNNLAKDWHGLKEYCYFSWNCSGDNILVSLWQRRNQSKKLNSFRRKARIIQWCNIIRSVYKILIVLQSKFILSPVVKNPSIVWGNPIPQCNFLKTKHTTPFPCVVLISW